MAACNACRKHKVKCSGDRPTCRRCAKRVLSCVYTTRPGERPSQALSRDHRDLRDRATVYQEIVQLLQNLPEQDAKDFLQRIRSGSDMATVLKHVKTGSLLLQMAVAPETRFRYEFPYRSEMPDLQDPDNPYLESLIYQSATLFVPKQQPSRAEPIAAGAAGNSRAEEFQSPYLKPFHAAHVVEPGITDAKISWWTTVCNDDMLMRDLLRVFFRCEYQFTAAFQKTLFLEDMAARRRDFCSSLLVNIVLAYACVCYPQFSDRAEYWNPQTLAYRFVAEAKRLWELDASEARITTVQAGMVFAVFHNLCGLDEIGRAYRVHGVALAHQLRLFDRAIDAESDRMRHGRAFTAWALYNWETLTGFSFLHPSLVPTPPDWPLPDPAEDEKWYGEIWVQYPLTPSLSASSFGHVFRTRCQFRIIMNEYCQAAYSKGAKVTIEDARGFHRRLRSWYDSLPAPLLPKTIVLPGHLQLHIYYHHLLLTIFEPLLDVDTDQEPLPKRVVADAKRHLQTLVRLYYLRHGFEAMDLFIVIPLMLMGYDCIDAVHERTPEDELEALRSTLFLVTHGLYNQRRNHYLAEALFRVIWGRMRPQEIALLKTTANLDEVEADLKRDMAQAVRSHWPVSVVKRIEDVDHHLLTNLVENYARLNVDATPAPAPSVSRV